MMNKVIIASDSTTDIGPELIARHGVKVLPLGINLGDRLYADGVDIHPDMIYKHYEETGELPKTSAINTTDFYEFFKEHTADGSAVVFFTISSAMSSTYGNACLAAKEFENVYVVDTANLSSGGGLLLLSACDMRDRGMRPEDIAKECTALREKVSASFVVDDLTFLYKGGRCSALAALGANLVQIKPCIAVKEGKMGVDRKYRGRFAAVLKKYIADQLEDGGDINLERAFVTHAGCDEEIVEQCASQVREALPFEEVIITRAGCTVSSHCGRNTLGVLFLRK